MNIGQWVYIYIENVEKSFIWINQTYPTSIFDEYMFGKLREWHKKYGLIYELHCNGENSDSVLFDLPSRYMEELVEEAYWLKLIKKSITSVETVLADINLDKLASNMSVERCIFLSEKILSDKLPYANLILKFSRISFEKTVSDMERYWRDFSRINVPLYLNTSLLIDGILYYTTCNTNYIFSKKADGTEEEIVAEIPCNFHNGMKFSALIHYKDCIWMVPWREKVFFIYDLKNRRLTKLPIPFGSERKIAPPYFFQALKYQQYLWMLPWLYPYLVRIDMETYAVKIYRNWPKGIDIKDDGQMNFCNMCIDGHYLYLFRNACSNNIRIDLNDEKMEIWDVATKFHYGTVKEGNVIIAPRKNGESLCICKLDSQEDCTEEELPATLWIEEKKRNEVAYRDVKCIDHEVYLLPFAANGILRKNLTDGKLDIIDINLEDYRTLWPDSHFRGYDAFQVGKGVLITSYQGNKAVIIDDSGTVKKILSFNLSIEKMKQPKRLTVKESKDRKITDLLKDIEEEGRWSMVEEVTTDKNGNVFNHKTCFNVGCQIWNIIQNEIAEGILMK